jgi:hypothetical protein
MKLIWELASLAAGGLIGVSFGWLQGAAARRHKKLEDSGELKTGWAIMPGSFRRVAYLMLVLVLVQIGCPLLFSDGCQWWVSGGVVAGYGCVLYAQLRRRLSRTN